MHFPAWLGTVKVTFFVDTFCTYNSLSKAILYHLPTTTQEKLKLCLPMRADFRLWKDGLEIPIFNVIPCLLDLC